MPYVAGVSNTINITDLSDDALDALLSMGSHRCPGCGEHTAPNADELCEPCVDNRPEYDEPTDVGFEGGDFA